MHLYIDSATLGIIIATLIGALLGGWAAAVFQNRLQKRTNKIELLWQFRLKLYEAEQAMWQESSYPDFKSPLNWIKVAASDPRINIDTIKISEFANYLDKGWKNLQEDKGAYDDDGEEIQGIDTKIINQIAILHKDLDEMIIAKIKVLK